MNMRVLKIKMRNFRFFWGMEEGKEVKNLMMEEFRVIEGRKSNEILGILRIGIGNIIIFFICLKISKLYILEVELGKFWRWII